MSLFFANAISLGGEALISGALLPYCFLEIVAPPTGRVLLKKISFNSAGAAARSYTYGLGNPAAAGISPSMTWPLVAADPSTPVPSLTIATAWAVEPTQPTKFFRRLTDLASQPDPGWNFPQGLGIYNGESLAVWVTGISGSSNRVNVGFSLEIDA